MRTDWRLESYVCVVLACITALCVQGTAAASSPQTAGIQATGKGFARLDGEGIPGLSTGLAAGTIHGLRNTRELADRKLNLTIVLHRSDEAGFERYLQAVQDHSSPLYGHFLSSAQQAARFGPSRATYDRLKSWLRGRGLAVVSGSANRLSLTVKGRTAEAERAFHTTIRRLRAGGRSVYANLEAPALPRGLAPSVQAVTGLSDLTQPIAAPADQHLCQNASSLANTPGNNKFKETCGNLCRAYAERTLPMGYAELLQEILLSFLPPIFSLAHTAVNGANSAWGLVGYCIGASAAGANPGFGNWASANGGAFGFSRRGSTAATPREGHSLGVKPQVGVAVPQKIGLLEFDTYNPSDVTDWLELEGIKPSIAGQLSKVNVNGGLASPGAGESEVLLDIDTVIGAAPLSNYVVYDAPASTTFAQMFQRMIADGDTVISNSWSQCEDQTPLADAQAIDSVLASAAASGITVLNGTGDGGSTCLDGSQDTIGVPADSPNATAVGGTSPTFGPGLTYGSESWWDEQEAAPAGGAGGYGVSRYFSRPSYQNGLTASSTRSVPDLSFTADPHAGVTLCQADAGGCPDGQLWGGTSMAAPAVAALVADFNEELGHNVGELNTALYPLANTGAFHTAESMKSDFAHVGLGAPDFNAIYEEMSGKTQGPVSPSVSVAGAIGRPQADGKQEGLVRVNLEDANGLPIGGKQVKLLASAGSKATISPASAATGTTDGAAVFTVTDKTTQTVTFTIEDATDSVTLKGHPELTFLAAAATGSSVLATPRVVLDNGSAKATISVYLQDSLGRPAAGKNVKLTAAGNATIGGSDEAETDGEGVATFTASDTSQESVRFTAVDQSDELPIPGEALVNFQAEGVPPCLDTTPKPLGGSPIELSPFASELPDNSQAYDTFSESITFEHHPCHGVTPPAFDAAGNVFVADEASGAIYVFGPAGGVAGPGTALPDTVPAVDALAFGKHGELYATLAATEGNDNKPELVQLDPSSGAIDRVIATSANGLHDFPSYLAVDPVSGDVFVVDDGGGAGTEHFSVTRVGNPDSATPALSDYANVEGVQTAVTFAPNGTMYVGVVSGPHESSIVSVSGTKSGSPGTVTQVATIPQQPFGVAVAETGEDGEAIALDAVNDQGSIYRVDLIAFPATVQQLAESKVFSTGASIGPDGCLYYAEQDLLLKATGVNSRCVNGSTNTGPRIALSANELNEPMTGSSVSFTAKLEGVASPQGTPIHFLITGANTQIKLVHADGGGSSALTYSGLFPGTDTVSASTEVNGRQINSAPIAFRWHKGRETSSLSLNASQGGGAIGQPATLRASLIDVSADPAAPIAGASVRLSLASGSCTATTDSEGSVSCQVTPPGGLGLDQVEASYAGSETFTPSTASGVFEAGGVGLTPMAIPISAPGQSPNPPISTPAAKRASPPLAQVLGLPSAQKCLSRRALTVHVHAPAGQKPLSVKLTLGKKVLRTVKFIKGKNHKIPSTVINLKGLPKGTFTLKILVKTKSKKTYSATRTYHTCVARKKAKSKQGGKH
jgi:Pro-kumamolisin, activation domain/Bacterial Ig-like domain (group 1)/Subtilase family